MEYDVPPPRKDPEPDAPPSLPPKKSFRSSFRDTEGLSRVTHDARPKPMPRRNLARNSSSPITSPTSPGVESPTVTDVLSFSTDSCSETQKVAPTPRPRRSSVKTASFRLTELQLDESESFKIPPSADDVEYMLDEMVMKEMAEEEELKRKEQEQRHQQQQSAGHGAQSQTSSGSSSTNSNWHSDNSSQRQSESVLETDFPANESLYENSGIDSDNYYENNSELMRDRDAAKPDTQSSSSCGAGSTADGGVDDGCDSAFGGSDDDYAKIRRQAENAVTHSRPETSFDPFQTNTQLAMTGVARLQPGLLQPTKVWSGSAGKDSPVDNSSVQPVAEVSDLDTTKPTTSVEYEAVWFAQRANSVQPGLVRPQSDLMVFSPKPHHGSSEPVYGDRSGEYIGLDPTYHIPPPHLPPPPLPAQAHVNSGPPSIPPRPNKPGPPNLPSKLIFHDSSHTAAESNPDAHVDPTSAVFSQLETPSFNPLPDDPFKYSGFDTECKMFNTPHASGQDTPSIAEDSSIYEIDDTGDDFVVEWPDPAAGGESDNYYHQIGAQGSAEDDCAVRLSQVPPPPPRARHGTPPARPAPKLVQRESPPPAVRREMPLPRSNIYSVARPDDIDSMQSAASADCSDSSEDAHYDPDGDSSSIPAPNTLGRGSTGYSGPISIVPGPLSPRKNDRYGYLQKQGGVKANRGWRLRWVVFNGSDLRYYDNSRTQISKKIIPLLSMKEVISDIKDGDTNRFKFRLVTTLRDRTFLFAADNRDDCCTWTNILMAAILKNQTTATVTSETELKKPDKEGFIRFENSKQYYVAIWGKTLCYYDSFEDFQMNCPVHEIDMKLSSVKDKKKNKLQLSTHYAHFWLVFDSPHEAQSWRMAIEDAIAEGLADDTVLEKVYENDSNRICADCDDKNPHWASINLGIVLCKKCAGVHRMFDTSISKIRSLRMDTRVWTPSLIELMKEIGNANANLFWEHDLMPVQKLLKDALPEERKQFAQLKYQQRHYSNQHDQAHSKKQLNEALLAVASTSNLLELMQVIFSGAELAYTGGPYKENAFQTAKRHGQRLLMELLYQNGGDCSNAEEDPENEGRLREDVRLQGYLLKTGPAGRTFDQRWCVLEHGTLTYYLNEKSTTAKDSIDRKNIFSLHEVPSDRPESVFEISTSKGSNRIYTFGAESEAERGMWMRTLGKLISPVAVMEHVGMMDFSMAALVFMRESVSEDWRSTWIMLSWRLLYFMNKDLKLDHIDLRKATQIRMQDPQSGNCPLCQEKGACFVLSSPGQTFYIQANLQRDTIRILETVTAYVKRSGESLLDQQLTQDNVPIIVDRCITQVYSRGQREEGIYRKSATQSRVAKLLQDLKTDAHAVRLDECDIHEVANALKLFLRKLEDSLFTRERYSEWIRTAQIPEHQNKLLWYRYLLEKLPLVNYSTLRRLVMHIWKLAQMESETKMNVEKLCTCFAPSLMCVETDTGRNNPGYEISVLTDIVSQRDYLFQIDQVERDTEARIQEAAQRILEISQDPRRSQVPGNFLVPITMYDPNGQDEMVSVTPSSTAKEVVEMLKKKCNLSGRKFALYEMLFRGSIVRPLFPSENILMTTGRWSTWDEMMRNKENVPCLCLADTERFERLDSHYDNSRPLFGEAKYADSKSKRFKKTAVEFKQCMLTFYKDVKAKSQLCSWKVEELTIYLGVEAKRSPPTKFGFTFLVNGKEEKSKSSMFGHCVCLPTEEEMYRWVAAMLVAQAPTPEGLLVWIR